MKESRDGQGAIGGGPIGPSLSISGELPAPFRIGLVSFLAAAIGLVAGLVAYALYQLIGLFTNLFFFHRWSTNFTSVRFHHLGPWVIQVPVVGGLIVGVMAKYGSSKIKGHGIPEAMELLLFEFKSRSFIPLVIASTLATAVHMQLLGPGPMFQVGSMDFGIPHALPFYLLLGPLCGLAAVGLSKALYWVEDLFEKVPIDELWWPAMGALALGIIGFFVPRVFGVGYDTIGDILNGQLMWKLLLVVMIAKFAALVIALGSGTSGGLLAPTFMWSAAMGGLFAMAGNYVFPSAHLSPGAFALVAMGAVFGAASRAAFTFIIFAFEITRDYNSVLPLMLVAVLADGIAMLFMPHSSIMTEKLARRGLRVHQDYEADALTQATVGETMVKEAPVIAADTKVGALAERIARHDPAVARHEALLILDGAGRLAGIITRGDVLRALDKDCSGTATVQEAGSTKLIVTYPDELVSEAAGKLLRYDLGRLPVVNREDETQVVGYLGRSAILAARLLRFHDEHVREPGWLAKSK